MTAAWAVQTSERFGIARVLSRTFALIIRNFPILLLAAAILAAVGSLVVQAVVTGIVVSDYDETPAPGIGSAWRHLLPLFAVAAIYCELRVPRKAALPRSSPPPSREAQTSDPSGAWPSAAMTAPRGPLRWVEIKSKLRGAA